MNKKIYFLGAILLLSVTFLGSCQNKKKTGTTTSESQEVATQAGGTTYTVDTENSKVFWVGNKALGGSHNGTLAVSVGEINVEDNQILSGSFELDLNKIVCDDLEGEMSEKLVGHLKSEDFFDVDKFPKGAFTITSTKVLSESADSCLISGNLKLKDIEKNISFKAKITQEGDFFTAKTETFEIDRTVFGVNYNSKNIFKNLKDNVINDEIVIRIEIRAKK